MNGPASGGGGGPPPETTQTSLAAEQTRLGPQANPASVAPASRGQTGAGQTHCPFEHTGSAHVQPDRHRQWMGTAGHEASPPLASAGASVAEPSRPWPPSPAAVVVVPLQPSSKVK